MNWLDPNLNEPVQFERITYISGLNGFQPGPPGALWDTETYESPSSDWTILKLAYEAQALVRIERVEDTVRFERALLRAFGRPARMGVGQTISQQEQKQHDGIVRYVRGRLRDQVLHRVGPAPGQHLTQRLSGFHT